MLWYDKKTEHVLCIIIFLLERKLICSTFYAIAVQKEELIALLWICMKEV